MTAQSRTIWLTGLLRSANLPPALEAQAVGGGDSGENIKAILEDGRCVFAKRAPGTPPDFHPAEATGLQALRQAIAPELARVPEVYHATEAGLLLEWLAPSARAGNYWEQLGRGLALVHSLAQPYYGFERDNYCGLTPQPNPRRQDGYSFFAEARLGHQARLARNRGLLSASASSRLDRICERLDRWVPKQSPALIHGDLWSGNAHTGPHGEPVLIDPAAHYGWAEADLAMTTLFGRFDPRFYESYQKNSPIASDWEDRAELYNLYHLLNHLNLFGETYLGSVEQILRRWT